MDESSGCKMKIVFLDALTIGAGSFAALEALGEFVGYGDSTPQEGLARVADCDVLIVNKFKVTPELLDAAPRLRLVCESGTGMNNIDVDACTARNIPVRNVAAYSTDTVAQTTFMHILSLLGDAPHFDRAVKSGAYSRSRILTEVFTPFVEAAGKTLGIIGLGAIGRKVAGIGEALGMDICYCSTSGANHTEDYQELTLDELLRTSDVVTIHAPMNDRTRGLIGAAELAKMKPTAYLVNMGRGGIVDEQALVDAVDGGTIAGAAVDVFTREPLPEDHPYMKAAHPERFRFTPHIGWGSAEARTRLVEGIAANIRAWMQGQHPDPPAC